MLYELKEKADSGRLVGDFSYAYELSEVVSKIKRIFNKKWQIEKLGEFPTSPEYFERLGCEVKRGIGFKEDKDHIVVSIIEPRELRAEWQIKVPVEIAEKALVIGFP